MYIYTLTSQSFTYLFEPYRKCLPSLEAINDSNEVHVYEDPKF